MTRLKDRKQPSWKVETHPHTGNLAVGSRAFPRLAYRKIEEGHEIEDIGERSVQPVVVDRMVVAYFVQTRHCTGCKRVERTRTGTAQSINELRSMAGTGGDEPCLTICW